MKTITKVSPDASPGACGANGSFHLPKSGLEFLLAAPLWGNQSVFSDTQFMVDIEKRIDLLFMPPSEFLTSIFFSF